MKQKTFLILVCCSLFLSLQAQHKLSGERNAYNAGDQLVKQQVVFKDPGASGKGLVWDFRFLQPVDDSEYNLNYFIPDSTDMTLLCGREHRTRYYSRQERDSLWATEYKIIKQ